MRLIPKGVKLFLFILTAVIFLITKNSEAQEPENGIKFKAPRLILEFSGSFDDPAGSSSGNVGDFFKFTNYGATYGLGFHLNIKYGANKKGSLYPYINLGFTQLQNDDNEKAYIDSNVISGGYPLPGNEQYKTTPGQSLIIIRTFYAGAGLQYVFTPKSKFMTYAGAEVNYCSIWGYYVQTPLLVVGSSPRVQTTFKINSAARVGIGISAGADYRISKYLGFVLGAKYKIDNLFGKKSERSTEKNTLNLLDKASENLNSNLNKNRNIEYFEFYLGFVVFVGTI
jgi:hypothetical protein